MVNDNMKIITISGEPASGKTTLRKNLQEMYSQMGYTVKTISIGEMFRDLAKDAGMTVEEFNKKAEKDPTIDDIVDNRIKEYARKIKEKGDPNTVYIFDSRMAWKFIPDAFSIRLTVAPAIAGHRAFEDNNRGREEKFENIEEATKRVQKRKKSEIKRYKDVYGVNLQDTDNYDLVIDTSFADQKQVLSVIRQCEERFRQKKEFPKLWASAKIFLPTQDIRQSCSLYKEKILSDPDFFLDHPISTFLVDGYKFVVDGHNRMLGAIEANRGLISYTQSSEDEETARKYIKSECNISRVYDHEQKDPKLGFCYGAYYGRYPNFSGEKLTDDDTPTR